jgi:AcrR family transcriptional regulator
MRDLVTDAGFASVTVSQIIARARVSRRTFYEHFTDCEDCLLAVLEPVACDLLADVRAATRAGRPGQAAASAAQALVAFAASRPARMRLLMSEPLAAGPRLLDASDQLMVDVAQLIEDARALAPSGASVPDVPALLICRTICRLLGSRVTRGEPLPRGIAGEVLAWLAGYERPLALHRRSTLAPLPIAACAPFPAASLRPPPRLASVRRRRWQGAVTENQWLRIVFATAEVVHREGYAATTVTQIARAAGVDSRTFYRLFASRQHALAEARRLLFGHVMATAAGASIRGETWQERIREAARAFTRCIGQNPTLATASLAHDAQSPALATASLARDAQSPALATASLARDAQSPALATASPARDARVAAATRPVVDLPRAFTIFMLEGRRCAAVSASRPPVSDVALELIATIVLEHARSRALHGGDGSGALADSQAGFYALAPLIGVSAATDLSHRRPVGDRRAAA